MVDLAQHRQFLYWVVWGTSLVSTVVAQLPQLWDLLGLAGCQHPVQPEGLSLDHWVGRRVCCNRRLPCLQGWNYIVTFRGGSSTKWTMSNNLCLTTPAVRYVIIQFLDSIHSCREVYGRKTKIGPLAPCHQSHYPRGGPCNFRQDSKDFHKLIYVLEKECCIVEPRHFPVVGIS